ncbi:hypothetical protein OsI_35986 [Oryza sativa Indica Group]|uniref:Uncharacterized protein n=1 Tax=Oryza sativa subsp. indica TaxID=39946 RepID=B8BKB7_ORYSI|nr:hypothetical protein OsI_35986 [Oryza sativa Indica Group]
MPKQVNELWAEVEQTHLLVFILCHWLTAPPDQGSSNRKSCLAAANIEENGIDAMLRMGSTCRRHKPAAPRLEGALEENTMVGGCYRGPVMVIVKEKQQCKKLHLLSQ